MIRLDDVIKDYGGWAARARRGTVRALDGISLAAPAGTALGVVGPNGAGKSTLIRLLLGYLHPTRGRVTIGDAAPRAYIERHGVAYVPDTVAIPPGWTVGGALRAFAALGEVEGAEERIEKVMETTGLMELAGRRVAALSKGGVQRLALAQALLGDRKVMVLDEPATGLDPEWIVRLRSIVADWRAADPGRVLVMASHDLDEVERMADRVAVLAAGRVREIIDLRAPEAGFPAYRLEVEGDTAALEAVRAAFPGAVAEHGAPLLYRVEPRDLADLNRGLAEALRRGVRVRALAPERATLEERYRRGGEGGE
jgi:ABC-2 type transport system ATP-binding protein